MFFSSWRYLQEWKDVLFVRFTPKQIIISQKMIIFEDYTRRYSRSENSNKIWFFARLFVSLPTKIDWL